MNALPLLQIPGVFVAGLAIIVLLVLLFVGFLLLNFFRVWLRALLSNAPVGIGTLIAMWLRNVPFALIVDARIMASKAGVPIPIEQFEQHFMAGGDVIQTTNAVIAAQKAGLRLDFNRSCTIDLATKGTNKSVIEAVLTSINPKVIDVPTRDTGRNTIDGVAKDGIQVKVKARVTVRSNLDRYVGSAQEETIIARVGEGIVTTIGSAESYKWVLENPDSISRRVLERGLDVGTAYEILSIDIADVDVGENVGAKLQEAQAIANKNMAQAQAEIRRAAAVATEQEMRAKTQEMQAKLVESQAEVPLAMAEALRAGKLGVMDYFRLKNIESDTDMRKAISGGDSSQSGSKS